MNKGQVLMKLSSWKDKYDIEEGMKELEKVLNENNMDFSNLEFMLRYSYDDYGEISISTKPSREFNRIRFNKIKK